MNYCKAGEVKNKKAVTDRSLQLVDEKEAVYTPLKVGVSGKDTNA